MRKVYCDTRKCLSCHTCEIACAVQHSQSGELSQAVAETPRPRHLVRVKTAMLGALPLRCHHCEDAACIDACKTGATYRDPQSGRVLIDHDRCVGCWMCIMVCPFGAVFPNMRTEKAQKCDLCAGHEEPACVSGCPTRALAYEEFAEFARRYRKGQRHKSVPAKK